MASCWVCQGSHKCTACRGTAITLLPAPIRGSSLRESIAIRCQGCAGTGCCPACSQGSASREGKVRQAA